MKGLLKRVITGLGLLALVAVAAWGSAQVDSWLEPEETLAESGRQIVLESGERVDLEQFVLYMAAAQMPADYGAEALKCQAVIVRTFLFRELQDAWEMSAADLGVVYLDESDMQTLWGVGYGENHQKFVEAVQTTAGQTLRFEGEYIAPVFHRMSAGSTRAGGETFPYLKAMDSAEDLLADESLTVVEVSLRDVVERLAAGTGCVLKPGEFWSKVQIVARDAAGYVERVQIRGEAWSGDEIAAVLGLPSPCFQWEAWEDGVRIFCRGCGHGYGLSQWGARAKAEQGSSYREILKYYYSGAEIQ